MRGPAGKMKRFLRARSVKRLSLAICLLLAFSFLLAEILSSPPEDGENSRQKFVTETLPTRSPPARQESWELFYPAWKDTGHWFVIPMPASTNTLNHIISRLLGIIRDPDRKIEPEFEVPDYLRDRVLFWMLVHSQYPKTFRIIHDRNNVGIIYGVLDLRPLYRQYGITKALENKIRQVESSVFKTLRQRLLEAVDLTPPLLLSAEEKDKIRTFLSRSGALSQSRVLSLINSLRTQTGQSDEFAQALQRSRQLLPHIESVFRQQGLPVALARLPFVESSFNPRAYSKVGAMGIWQFMPQTARELIHRDDRRAWSDPIEQTKAAAKLLRNYRSVLPDWGTTITSYNSGIGRVWRLVRKHNLNDYDSLAHLSDQETGFGFAGLNFYAQFLSANLVEAYRLRLFDVILYPEDVPRTFGDQGPFPKEICDL